MKEVSEFEIYFLNFNFLNMNISFTIQNVCMKF